MCLSLRMHTDMAMNEKCFLLVFDVIVLNFLDMGTSMYSSSMTLVIYNLSGFVMHSSESELFQTNRFIIYNALEIILVFLTN